MYTDLTLISAPHEVSFTGNPMPFVWQIVPYATREKNSEITLTVRVMLEQNFGSEIFEEIYVQKLLPDDKGQIRLDVHTIIDPYLQYYIPSRQLNVPIECKQTRKRYEIVTTFDAPGLYPPEWYDLPVVHPVRTFYHAIKGGLSKEAWHKQEFFTNVISEQKLPLRFAAKNEKVSEKMRHWLFWLYPFDDNEPQTVTYKVYLNDGTWFTIPGNTASGGKWSVHCVPAGFEQVGLDEYVPETKFPVSYSISIATDENEIVQEHFYYIDPRNFYEAYLLAYRNSLGGLETIRLTGTVELQAEYSRQITTPHFFAGVKKENKITTEKFIYNATTGFLSREEAMKTRDLLLSGEVYMMIGEELRPVVIDTNKTKFYANQDNLIGIEILWQSAYENNFFSPLGLMPTSRACPPVETFSVYQPHKSTLVFTYSLLPPYEDIEVSYTIDDVEYTNQYKGNSGMVYQSFENPLTGAYTQYITVKARTICDPDALPAHYGPYKTVSFLITGDFPPVAVDDYFQVPEGFTGELPFSLLDNDYDPDGEEIEAVPVTGIFGDGNTPGVYQVDIRGIVTILESATLQGRQGFQYQIKNPGPEGMYATGTVWINFGTGPQSVFVKWVFRNISYGTAQGGQWMNAEAWLDFFSDAACTVPLDLTGKNITINAKAVATGSQTGSQNFTFLADGMRRLMRQKNNIYLKGSKGFDFEIIFTVLPGTGYIPVNP